MASAVTAPLERQFGQVAGLNQMTSTSSEGCSVITLQFTLDLDIDVAEQEVQAAINASGTYLPKIFPTRRSTARSIPPTRRFSRLALTSNTMPLPQVEDLADTRLAQKSPSLAASAWSASAAGKNPPSESRPIRPSSPPSD